MRGPIDQRPAPRAGRQPAAARTAVATRRRRYPRGKALERIRFFETQRALPEADVVDGRVVMPEAAAPRILRARGPRSRKPAAPAVYQSAAKAKDRLVPDFAASTSQPVWSPLGPTLIPKGQTYGSGPGAKPPVSGRAVGVLISPTNPRHLVLCSGGGGLWGTLDQGATWQPLTDQQPTLSMGAIAAAPSSPNIAYAATGEGDNLSRLGVGLLRSSDGGQSWQLVTSSALSGSGVYDLAVDPTQPLRVWVGTTAALLETTDGGATFRTAQPAQTWDISIHPTRSEIFAATAAGLIRSTNGGSTWRRVSLPGTTAGTSFERMEVCHAPSKPGVVYVAAVFGNQAALWRRGTYGGAFSSETTPTFDADSDIAQAWYDWCFAVSPSDPNQVYWGAVELFRGLRVSSRFSWRKISSRSSGDSIHPDQHHLAFDPSDPDVLYACNDGGLFRSPDGGNHWTSLNPGLGITEYEFLSHLESQDAWIIGGTQDNGTLSHAGNETWNQIALGDGGDCGADDGKKLCYHSYYGMWIERAPATGPQAFRWKDVSPPFAEGYDALFYPPMDVRGSVVAKAGATLFVSGDDGDHWDEIDFGGNGALASALLIADATTILVGAQNGTLVRVKRPPSGWANASVTPLAKPRPAYLSDIVAVGSPTGVLWVSSSEFGGGHVFRSTNGGQSWAHRGGNLPDIPVNAIVVDPQDPARVFAATDHGVYRTSNAGTTWTDFSNGLPNAVVGDMILHERLRVLRVGTRNRGAWEVKI